MEEIKSLNTLINDKNNLRLIKFKKFDYNNYNVNDIINFYNKNGFICIENFFNKKKVIDLKESILEYLKLNHPFEFDKKIGYNLTGIDQINNSSEYLDIIYSNEIKKLLKNIFKKNFEGLNSYTRLKGIKESTDIHSDYYRFYGHMKKGDIVNIWIPLTSQSFDQGTLCLLNKIFNKFEYSYHNILDNYELPKEFFEIIKDSIWNYGEMEPGDLLLFDLNLIHGSFQNNTKDFRLSIDTRWFSKFEKNI